MKEAKYITPRLGRRSGFVLGLMCIGAITLCAGYLRNLNANTLVSESLALSQFRYLMWLTGMTYGVAAGVCWLATIVDARYVRWMARAGTVVLLSLVQERLGMENWLRSLSNLGGLVFFQCLLFYRLGVPNWMTGEGRVATNNALRKGQFGIGDIVIATTCIAFLLAIAIRYRTPVDPLGYWLVLTLFWLVGPLIAACTALSFLNRQGLSIGLLAIAVLLAVGGIAGLTAAELLLIDSRQGPATVTVGINPSFYGRIILGYLLTFVLFCIVARTDRIDTPEPDI
jgi:hypothetical protein